MDYLVQQKEAKVIAAADKIFGDKDAMLKCAYVMTEKRASEGEKQAAVNMMSEMNNELARAVYDEMEFTLDQSGNVVEVKKCDE